MRFIATGVLVIVLAGFALAQTPAPGTQSHSHDSMGMGMNMPPGMDIDMSALRGPIAIMGDWWKNPETAMELRLTDAQKRQLEQASLNVRLALIDAGADGLKAFVRAQSLLDADQLDEAAYTQQVNALSTAAGNLVKEFGQLGLTVRRTLSTEQWRKLEGMRAAHRPARPMQPMPPAAPARPRQPAPPPPAQ